MRPLSKTNSRLRAQVTPKIASRGKTRCNYDETVDDMRRKTKGGKDETSPLSSTIVVLSVVCKSTFGQVEDAHYCFRIPGGSL